MEYVHVLNKNFARKPGNGIGGNEPTLQIGIHYKLFWDT